MLQNVEHAYEAKGLTERAVPNVSLNQQTGRSSLPVPQTVKPEFQTDDHSLRTSFAEHSKYVARSTSNLQHEVSRRQLGRNPSRQFENQTIPSSEPEVLVFDASQLFEKRRIVAAAQHALTTCPSFFFRGNRF